MESDYIKRTIEDKKETNHVDFKRVFYRSLSESDLSKDIAAFANTVSDSDKYIIIGVDDKTREVLGIDENTLPDQDILDNYLSDNIEPFVNVEIGSIKYEENVAIGYIRVFANNLDRPYIIKKDCGKNNSIRQGDIFVRKGTVIKKASRADLERIRRGSGAVLLQLRDDLICIEPIVNADPIVKDPTYGYFDLEIYNDTSGSVLLDDGRIIISTNNHQVTRRIVSIMPKKRINNDPLEVTAGSRAVHQCLFDFLSQDCVDFGFDSEGWMKDDVNVHVELIDTDGNTYRSGVKCVTLRAKGDILHKVKLKNKSNIKLVKRRLF